MISATIGSSPAERDGHLYGATLAEGVLLTCLDAICASPIAEDALIYIAYGANRRLFDAGGNSRAL